MSQKTSTPSPRTVAPSRLQPGKAESDGARSQRRASAADADGEAAEFLPSELLVDSLGYAIKRAQVRSYEALYRFLPAELSPTRMSALSTIDANPGISQSALGSLLHIAGPSVVKVVDSLERLGFVERQPAKQDRRVYALVLTRAGRAELEHCRQLVASFEKEIASKLTVGERRQLLQLLSRVAT
jgi:DNA-binding MarR family transcriptional regulator